MKERDAAAAQRASPLISVGLVTWNSAADLPACLGSLESQTHPNLEILLVDNGSSDASVRLVRERFLQARVIQNPANEGYCRAHNQAIRAARGEHYLALNPDVQLHPEFIQRLAAALEGHPGCGSAVGKFHQPSSGGQPILDSAGLFIDRRRHQYLRGHGEVDRGQYDQPGEVFGADGAAPLHRMRMLDDVRMMGEYYDEDFFAYMEDVDLTWRARLMGWSCWYEPAAGAVHERSFKPGRRKPIPRRLRRLAVKNRYLTLLKNEAGDTYRRDWWRIHLYDLQILAYLLLLEQSSLPAYWMLSRGWSRARAWRQEIWSRARATPEARRTWFG